MKNKAEVLSLFLKKGILSNKSGLTRRPYNWRLRFDHEAEQIWLEFVKQYQNEAEAWYCLCRNVEPSICPVCNINPVKFGDKGFKTTCEKCSANSVPTKIKKFKETVGNHTDEQRKLKYERIKQTKRIKYGDENYMMYGSETFYQKMVDRYGDEHYNNSEQIKQTCLEKFGCVTNLLIPEIHEMAIERSKSAKSKIHRSETMIKRYGVDCLAHSEKLMAKAWDTKHKKIHEIEQQYNCTLEADIIKKYGLGWKALDLNILRFTEYPSFAFISNDDIPTIERYANEGYHTNGYTSKLEKDLLAYIKSIYFGEIIENDTSIVKNDNYHFYELDIYLPELKIGIDFDGSYWHSIKFKDKFYHQRKTAACRSQGIQFIHVYEHMWKDEHDRICMILKNIIAGEYNIFE